ncbi:MAG TPA: hypothetical protein VEB88_05895 [Candidatus Acidoferrales bacterium]|jgi:glyoxylase-like metal-dependent hydrolase (beta-lactamase superfamily II)|nr:hypothetical protein [Candidatus Acidoferrales bacterium]
MLTSLRCRPRLGNILIAGETGLRDVGIPLEGKIMETPGHIAGSISARLDDGTCRVGDATENLFQQKK